MTRHNLALISIAGSCLDLLGALYLAYDLLGGEHGPLRALSRGVTYGAIFTIAYWIPLGPVFGTAIGLTTGITLAWEFSQASRGKLLAGFWRDTAASAIRGCGYAIGVAAYFGIESGLIFGAVSTLFQVGAYSLGVRPTMNYAPAPHFRFSWFQVLAVFNRTVGYGFTAWLCAQLAHQPQRALDFALRVGLTLGFVTFISTSSTPVIEWAADRVPEKRMGAFGVVLMVSGFLLQSVQYWIALLDVPVF
jgi:hypothetical protein